MMVSNIAQFASDSAKAPCDVDLSPQKRAWLRLARTPGVGARTFYQILRVYPNPAMALEAGVTALRTSGSAMEPPRGVLRALTRKGGEVPSDAVIDAEWAAHRAQGAWLLIPSDPGYPEAFHRMEEPPPVLSVWGRWELLHKPAVAMVGARNASIPGQRFAETMARRLGEHGRVIVSGLARGMDAAAHRGALETGTVAVMAGGVNHVYPLEHRPLYEAIQRTGVLISEQPWGTSPLALHFPQRNRLIAGLSDGVVVIEAAEKSGSLITAHCALELGRELMVVPGSPLDVRNRGSHRLIRQGACLVEDADDVLEALSMMFSASSPLRSQRIPAVDIAQKPSESRAVKDVLPANEESGDDGVGTNVERAHDASAVVNEPDWQQIILACLGGVELALDDLHDAVLQRAHEVSARAHACGSDSGREAFHLALLALQLEGQVFQTSAGLIGRF